MPDHTAKTKVKEASIEATIIRADGTVEKLGVVSYYHRRWWKRAAWALKQKLGKT